MKRKLFVSLLCAVLFLLLIFALRTVDVRAIGPEGTAVGLSRINEAVHASLGVNMLWYQITEILGYAAIAVGGLFALLGLAQCLRRRSLLRVDGEILALGVLYGAVIVLYLLFELAIVNYRPVLLPGEMQPEASFPSSHTMLSCVILGSAAVLLPVFVRSAGLRRGLQALCWLVLAVSVAGRLLSGVHWFTDILGGVLLSAALISFYAWVVEALRPRRSRASGGKHLPKR